ncbi:peptidase S66 [Virgisporangium aliadipatigenens]|uniref:Peptidase S66 n=1 Tax=Virgisporangium aliadipatigenens TaxID=741659 RepID=A0A8J3YFQ5_9ACTN|nr:LD-carboxypeptidase [Virgisporangium aliadipatigenens]GIJ43428.1 peptidase S66 [Virgisporangium aliadipatigenens]
MHGPGLAPSQPVQVLRPQALRPGDRVRIVAPAGPVDERLNRGIELLRGFGLEVEVGAHVHKHNGYLAGTDDERLADLDAALRDPGIRGVFAAAGGYGTQRIVDRLDLSALAADPRVFMGFSDITALHHRLWREHRLATFYGPVMVWGDGRLGPECVESLRRCLMTGEPIVLHSDPAEPSAEIRVPGRATGRLVGGNLYMLTAAIGTPDFPDLDGAILMFEDVGEAPANYDSMLTHLRRIGALDRLAGIAIGHLVEFSGGHWARRAYRWANPDARRSWIADTTASIRDRVADLGVPVLGGLPIGHGSGQLTVPLGTTAFLDAESGTLTVEPGTAPPAGAPAA